MTKKWPEDPFLLRRSLSLHHQPSSRRHKIPRQLCERLSQRHIGALCIPLAINNYRLRKDNREHHPSNNQRHDPISGHERASTQQVWTQLPERRRGDETKDREPSRRPSRMGHLPSSTGLPSRSLYQDSSPRHIQQPHHATGPYQTAPNRTTGHSHPSTIRRVCNHRRQRATSLGHLTPH